MIIDVIQGGLGNQMFQYAFGYALGRENGEKLYLDFSHYKINKEREPLLLSFGIPFSENLSYGYFPRKMWTFWAEILTNMVQSKVFRYSYNEYKKGHNKKVQWIEEQTKEFSIYERNKKHKDSVVLGFWQNENYFKKYRMDLIKQFRPKHPYEPCVEELLAEAKNTNSVSLHIRRGDYLKLNITMSMDYYERAIDHLKEQIENPKFFLFSDDIEWVKENLPLDENTTYVKIETKTRDIDEMMVMASCKHNIIANSTYSWWGAWLNDNEEKIVIAPKDGFITESLIPESWIKV